MAVYRLNEKIDRSSYKTYTDRNDQIEKILKAIDQDISTLKSCHNLDDVKEATWRFRDLEVYLSKIEQQEDPFYYLRNVDRSFEYDFDSTDFETMTCLLKELKATKKVFQDKLDSNLEYLDRLKEVESDIEGLTKKYKLIDKVTGEYSIYYIFEPSELSHQACIKFVDDVAEAIKGDYHFTGRGGSWTKWDLRSDNGVSVKAGWTGSDSPYRNEELWEVELHRDLA